MKYKYTFPQQQLYYTQNVNRFSLRIAIDYLKQTQNNLSKSDKKLRQRQMAV